MELISSSATLAQKALSSQRKRTDLFGDGSSSGGSSAPGGATIGSCSPGCVPFSSGGAASPFGSGHKNRFSSSKEICSGVGQGPAGPAGGQGASPPGGRAGATPPGG